MIVELQGIDPKNQGAGLMLEAICAQLRARYPNVDIAVPWTWPVRSRLAYGLFCTLPRQLPKRAASNVLRLLPGRLRRRLGFASPADVDVLLDASGFAYGDYWGVDKLRQRLVEPLKTWRRGNKAVILLPQALGSFDKPGMAEAFKAVLAKADLVFVRDASSMKFVQALGGEMGRVRSAPDFTNLLHPELPERLRGLAGAAILIPNQKVVAGRSDEDRKIYLDFLRQAAEILAATGRQTLILIHEGAGDAALARELNEKLATPLPIVEEPEPLVTKALIGAAHLVVSSRFHGLVSALAAGVPALACGWTHKYRELMTDYGCPEMVVELKAGGDGAARVQALVREADDQGYRDRLAAASGVQREKSAAAWEHVFAILDRFDGASTR